MKAKGYNVWRQQHGQTSWIKTAEYLFARSDKEAQSKLKRKFHSAAFHNMSLIALSEEQTPHTLP